MGPYNSIGCGLFEDDMASALPNTLEAERWSTLIASSPETLRSSGIDSDFEGRQDRLLELLGWKFLQVQFSSFLEVCEGFPQP